MILLALLVTWVLTTAYFVFIAYDTGYDKGYNDAKNPPWV